MTTEYAAPKLDKNDPDVIVRAYKFALKPTTSQEQKLRQHIGASRFVYNSQLALWHQTLDIRSKEKQRGVSEDELTPFPFSFHRFSIQNQWNATKDERAPWNREVSKGAYEDGCRRVSIALTNWYKSKTGECKGRKVGLPRFHKRGRHDSCTFYNNPIRVNPDRYSVTLPRLGVIKTYENTRKLQRKIAKGTARIVSATISRGHKYWHVSFTVYERKHIPETHRNPGSVVGIDMGVGDHVVAAANPHGDEVMRRGLPTTISDHEKRIRHLQRKMSRKRGPDTRTKATPSNRWVRANNQVRKHYNMMANVRRDFAAKAAHELANNYATVVIEDLNVQAMMARGGAYKRGLNRAIAQASFADLRRRITYKTQWNGGVIVVADRWFPSSKTCSRCGEVKSKLSLSEREYMCHRCGVVVDRDLNAATNLAKLAVPKSGVSNIDRTGSSPGMGRGGAGKTVVSSDARALASEASMARKGLSGCKAGTR